MTTFEVTRTVQCDGKFCGPVFAGRRYCGWMDGPTRCTLFDSLLVLSPEGQLRCPACLEAEKTSLAKKGTPNG